ncbi:hypothetical protein [Bradyrhizobium ottawaense]|uniref:hypothetical protein n=1 Tax=Bradyrhizobium ottawaense TaxID=931866 RepID=UPI0030F3ABD1
MRRKERLPSNRKWTNEDWQAAAELIATDLDSTLTDMRPAALPSYHTFVKRSRTDDRLRVLLEAAIKRRKTAYAAAGLRFAGTGWAGPVGTPRKPPSGAKFGRGRQYSDAAYSEYLVRLKADETAKSMEDATRLYWPGLPTFWSVMRRRRVDLRQVLKDRGLLKPKGRRTGAAVYSDEIYSRAIELVSTLSLKQYGDYREANPSERLPSCQAIFKRADRHPDFAAKLYSVRPKVERATFRYSNEVYEAAISKIGEAGWNEYLADCKPGVWPSLNAIYKRARSDKEFKARLYGKTRERYRLKRQLKGLIARRRKSAAIDRPGGQLGFLLLQQDAYRTADGFVPRHYERSDRDDIKQDIVTAVLMGEFGIDEIGEHAKWFISEHFRGGVFSSGRFGSLDAPIYDDSDLAYIDRLSSDDYQHIG